MTSPYLTIEEAVQYLRLEKHKSPRHCIYHYVRHKKLKCVKRVKEFLFKAEWLDDFLRRQS